MIKRTPLLLFLWTLLSFTPAYARCDRAGCFGIRAGASWNSLSNIDGILVSEEYYTGYTFTDKSCFAPTASVFFNYHKYRSYLGLEVAITYRQTGGSAIYSDVNGLTYTMGLLYHMMGAEAYLKVYPILGLNVGFGGFAMCNLTPSNLMYTSNQEDEPFYSVYKETVSETKGYLVDKISGKTDLGVSVTLGYDFDFGLTLQASYGYSLNDLIETRDNVYNWADPKNAGHRVALTIGWAWSVTRR